MRVSACAHVCVYMHVRECMRAHVCVRVHACEWVLVRACVHRHACTCIHATMAWRPAAQAPFPRETEDVKAAQTVAADVPVSSPRLGPPVPLQGRPVTGGLTLAALRLSPNAAV